ncbi:MAG: STAS domain-containing protein [Myxococcota bacterium]|nr:STAS domain-containing protein [Myxococcota bacterium]
MNTHCTNPMISVPHDMTGELALSIAPELRRLFDARRGEQQVVLDFEQVRSIDASGVAVLVRAIGWASASRRELSLARVCPEVRGELERIGLAHMLGVKSRTRQRVSRPWTRLIHAMFANG